MYDTYTTSLPPYIKELLKQHNEALVGIYAYLNKIGFKTGLITPEKCRRNTRMSLKVVHINDTVDCGGNFEDEDGTAFYVSTEIVIPAEFDADKYKEVTRELSKFKDEKPEGLEHVQLDFFSFDRKLKIPTLGADDNLEYYLKFRIHHLQ